MQTQEDREEQWGPPRTSMTPPYYRTGPRDVYAFLMERYGHAAWEMHAEMELWQYLWRCRDKGRYAEDMHKMAVICQRIVEERQRQCSQDKETHP